MTHYKEYIFHPMDLGRIKEVISLSLSLSLSPIKFTLTFHKMAFVDKMIPPCYRKLQLETTSPLVSSLMTQSGSFTTVSSTMEVYSSHTHTHTHTHMNSRCVQYRLLFKLSHVESVRYCVCLVTHCLPSLSLPTL